MNRRIITALWATCAIAAAEKTNPVKSPAPAVKTKIVAKAKQPAKPAVPAEKPDVEAAIPDSVKALGEPVMMDFPNGIRMAITAATDQAQAHVIQGLNHLHGGWEFEASRHFAAAMREDPDCLLAHWGMLMSMLSPSPETERARVAVTTRLLDLVDAGKGSELERGYAYGLIKYLEEGPTGAAAAFRKVAAQFPNDMQAGIFAALFSRTGYDDFGSATPDQETAEKSLEALIAKYPDSPLPMNALLTIRAEAPDLTGSLEMARKLVQKAPDYPPFFHLLGHYEWRCGQHGRAASAFGRASSFYEKWMKESQASVADCPEWIKAECYRVVAVVSKGDFDTAYAAARQVAATPVPKGRGSSEGGRLLLWEAKTLPARVLLHRGLRGNAHEALSSLPTPQELTETRADSLAYWWIDGLRLALDARRLLDEGKTSEAKDVVDALTHHGEAMSKTQELALRNGERSAWNRGFRGMEVLASEMRGRMAMAGPAERVGTAYNWFASATDRQKPATMMFPPVLLTPMAIHLGEYFLASHKNPEAVEAYQRALGAFPNNMTALSGLKSAFEASQLPADAAQIQKKIEELQAQ